MKANPLTSAGARQERKAVRAYLRRKLQGPARYKDDDPGEFDILSEVLDWVLKRQRRYDKAPGGLGKR